VYRVIASIAAPGAIESYYGRIARSLSQPGNVSFLQAAFRQAMTERDGLKMIDLPKVCLDCSRNHGCNAMWMLRVGSHAARGGMDD